MNSSAGFAIGSPRTLSKNRQCDQMMLSVHRRQVGLFGCQNYSLSANDNKNPTRQNPPQEFLITKLIIYDYLAKINNLFDYFS